jgi:hypothetical protein
MEVDGTGLGSHTMAGFIFSYTKPTGVAARVLGKVKLSLFLTN